MSDGKSDVIVVGCGMGGMAAAAAALEGGATIKMAEAMVDLKRACGVSPARNGYFTARPPRERINELITLYGMDPLRQKPGAR